MAQVLTVKKPSLELQDLISKVSNAFGKLQDTVNLVLERGREEGFSDKELGDMIREKMTSAGYSRGQDYIAHENDPNYFDKVIPPSENYTTK